MLRIIPCRDFFAAILGGIEEFNCHTFVEFILTTAHETKFKEDAIEYLDNLAQEVLGLTHGCETN